MILPCTVVQESESCVVSAGSVDGGPYMTWFLQMFSVPNATRDSSFSTNLIKFDKHMYD